MDETVDQPRSPLSQTALTTAQAQALNHVHSNARLSQNRMRKIAETILLNAGVTFATVEDLLARINQHARVTLNFHPDRILPTGITVIEGLLSSGIYQSQFVTGVTNGSRTAFPGGDRDCWEEKLFGGAYQASNVLEKERPKYGALNLMDYADGASPRFGSCYFQLRPHLLRRCTFTFGDSHTGPEYIGTGECFDSVLAALLQGVETNGEALGSPNMNIPAVVNQLMGLQPFESASTSRRVGRALDDYVEAQVHGDIDLSTDVEALIADPSYQNTLTGAQLLQLCDRYGIKQIWHPGFRIAVQDVPEDFRGPTMPPLAMRINQRFGLTAGVLDAATIGRAAADFYHQPGNWKDWDVPDVTWQHLKQIWHVLVRYGRQDP
ncbi:hypothetical protein AN963_21585 [Brevibacillus choshinensis]|uniref:DUF3626 domain-containing protein n=1 Tax=Brevibacillus choshinensis TaxID=54911 RepID=A0ABR5N0K4_BRECH|nr:DUF3626 domain-containing protein [Brevibacillus choshinensis]KQL44034.1 hypothetical protein AN963_21585 [Brevibacillus choshinensis]